MGAPELLTLLIVLAILLGPPVLFVRWLVRRSPRMSEQIDPTHPSVDP